VLTALEAHAAGFATARRCLRLLVGLCAWSLVFIFKNIEWQDSLLKSDTKTANNIVF